MQILPLATSAQAAAASSALQITEAANRQSALFASLLDSSRTSSDAVFDASSTTGLSSSTATTGATTASSAASSTIVDPLAAAQAPSQQELMNLPMTREDLAALHDDLTKQGFSEDEISDMQAQVDSPQGMTWGQMMDKVKKKVSKTESTEKKDVSNTDTVQLLGLFGKLGFTPAESQKLVDSLAKGETQSVWAAVDGKVSSLPKDESVSLDSSEMSTLARAMNLSDDAQKRLTALFDQSSAASGLSGQGLATALDLVKNELLAQLGKENQALANFRQSASTVLAKAWERQTGKLNADLHQDDVARKAAQVVAMNGEKAAKTQDVPSAIKPGVDVLADVPESVRNARKEEVTAKDVAASTLQSGTAAGQNDKTASQGDKTASQNSKAVAELAGRAGAVATAQAVASGQVGKETAGQQAATGETPQPQLAHKTVASTPQFTGSGSGGSAAGQQQGGNAGGTFEQTGQQGGWGEFWSKVRLDKTATQVTSTLKGTTTQTMAAMDAVSGSATGNAAKTLDPTLAARAARQLETGILRNVGQDVKQLTLKLSPDELGKLSVTITVKDKEVKAVITADNPDTATMLHEQAAKIKQTLEDQGFKVTQLDVRSGIAQDNQSAWQSPEQHNQAREQREVMDRMLSSMRMARENGLALDGSVSGFDPTSLTTRAEGLDLFA